MNPKMTVYINLDFIKIPLLLKTYQKFSDYYVKRQKKIGINSVFGRQKLRHFLPRSKKVNEPKVSKKMACLKKLEKKLT
jgi:hypothetical protein